MPTQYLIKNATLIHPGHSKHLKKSDFLIRSGKIEKIGSNIKADATLIEGKDLCVSQGWIDLRTHLTDPGFEFKENLVGLCKTAAAGGFTAICTLPDSDPVIDNKSSIEYLLNRTKGTLTEVYPIGAVSDKMEGTNLSEMYDMHLHGAVAFSDGDKTLSSGLLKKALMYVKSFGARIFSFPLDRSIHQDAVVNESENTVTTGLKGSPSLAEYTSVKQQLDIAAYCESPIHFSGITCKESVELIRAAKRKGQEVTCDTPIFNLCWTDEVMEKFDSDLKLMPLLRTSKDRKALIKGLADGTIDAITTNHHPQNVELKKVEFDYADFGSLSHQTFLPMALSVGKDLSPEDLIRSVTSGPRRILGLSDCEIREGEEANLTVFSSSENWTYDSSSNLSLSSNSYLLNSVLHGKVKAVFHNKKVNLY